MSEKENINPVELVGDTPFRTSGKNLVNQRMEELKEFGATVLSKII
jgi:hypothetical protein